MESMATTNVPEASPILGRGQPLDREQTNGFTDSMTASRISTLDACYEVVKEKLERLREEIRRIRINKQQEQLHQSIRAKRYSVDSNGSSSATANGQMLMPPTLIPSASSVSPARARYRLSDARNVHNEADSSSNEEEVKEDDQKKSKSNRSRRHQYSNGDLTKRSPKLGQKAKLVKQPSRTSSQEGSESSSPPSRQQHATRHKSLNARAKLSPKSQQVNGASPETSAPIKKTFVAPSQALNGSTNKLATGQAKGAEEIPVTPNQPNIPEGIKEVVDTQHRRPRSGSLQRNSGALVLSTVVLPSHSLQQTPSQQQQVMRRPPRSFTVRTNATPDNDLVDGGEAKPILLPVPSHSAGHSAPVSPNKCLMVPLATTFDIDAPAGSRSSGSGSQSYDTPPVDHPPNSSLNVAVHVSTPGPSKPLLNAKEKSPSIPVISSHTKLPVPSTSHAGSTPVLIGGAKSMAISNMSGVAKQQAANKLVSAIMGVPSSFLTNADNSSYENLDQISSGSNRGYPSTRSGDSNCSASSGPPPPFPLPSTIAATNKAGYVKNHKANNDVDGAELVPVLPSTNQPPLQPLAAHISKDPEMRKERLKQRKSAVLPSEAEHNNEIARNRKNFSQRSSLDMTSPSAINSLALACQDTDSELEGIFGECEAIDEYETSTNMSDSPSLCVWPVMIGNNVVVTKRKPRAFGSQQQQSFNKRKDPPRVADAMQAALIVNRRGSLVRPRPTAINNFQNKNRSSASLPVAAAKEDSKGVLSAPESQQVSPSIPSNPNVEVKLPPADPPPKVLPPPPLTLLIPPAMTNLDQRAPAITSPKITPSAISSIRRQRASSGQSSTKTPPVQNLNTASQIATTGKPSLTGMLYGADAAKVANQHLSQYTFRGNLLHQKLGSGGSSSRQALSKSAATGSTAISGSASADGSVIRPMAIGGTLSVNNLPATRQAGSTGSSTGNPATSSTSNLAPGQVSIASMIFNNPLQVQAATGHSRQQPAKQQADGESKSTKSATGNHIAAPAQSSTTEDSSSPNKGQRRHHHRHHHHSHNRHNRHRSREDGANNTSSAVSKRRTAEAAAPTVTT